MTLEEEAYELISSGADAQKISMWKLEQYETNDLNEVNEAVTNAEQRWKESDEYGSRERQESEFDKKIGKNVRVGNKKITLDMLTDLDLSEVSFSKTAQDDWEYDFDHVVNNEEFFNFTDNQKQNLLALKSQLEELDELEETSDELDVRRLEAWEFARKFASLDMTLDDDRETVYNYWKKIDKLYDGNSQSNGGEGEVTNLKKALENFQTTAKVAPLEDDIKNKIKGLKLPDNYIIENQPLKLELSQKHDRMMRYLQMMFNVTEELDDAAPSTYQHLTASSKAKRGDTRNPKNPFPQTNDPSAEKTREALAGKTTGSRRLSYHDAAKEGKPIMPTGKSPSELTERAEDDAEDKKYTGVDPIFYHLYLREITALPIMKSEIGEFKEYLEEFIIEANEWRKDGETSPREEALKRFNYKVKRLDKEANRLRENTHLPISSWLQQILGGEVKGASSSIVDTKTKRVQIKGVQIKTKLDYIERTTNKFLEDLKDILLEESIQMPVSQLAYDKRAKDHAGRGQQYIPPSGAGPSEGSKLKPTGQGLKIPRAQSFEKPTKRAEFHSFEENEDDSVEMAEFKKASKLLINFLNKYYFNPMAQTRFFPTGDKPSFSNSNSFSSLNFAYGKSPLSRGLQRFSKSKYLSLSELQDVYNYLNLEETQETVKESKRYLKTLNNLVDSLTAIFGDELAAKTYAASQLKDRLDITKQPEELDNIEIKGDNAKELYEQFDKDNSIVGGLRSYLQSPMVQSYISKISKYEDTGKLEKVIENILEITSPDKHRDVEKMAKSLLNAHDVVREMQGKEVVYGKLNINNIEAMDYIITKIDSKYKVDINASDVYSIVKSSNSFKSLSLNHGLSENIIYEIKALCR